MGHRLALVAVILLSFGAGALPARATTYVSNLAQPLSIEFLSQGTIAHASSFRTGPAATQLVSITVAVFANSSGTAELRLRADSAGSPGALIESLGSLTLPSPGPGQLTYHSPGSPTLAASTTYWVTLGETGSGELLWESTTSTSQTSPASWTIGDAMKRSYNGGALWVDVLDVTPPVVTGKFAVDATLPPFVPDLAVSDRQAIFGVARATGNRMILSGCVDSGCSSTVGSGLPLGTPEGLVQLADGSLVVCDDTARSVFKIDPATGNRTVISGCADAACSSMVGTGTVVGTGILLLEPIDVVVAGSSLLVTDLRMSDGHGALVSIDPTTGNRTTISGCANDACSSVVGSGRNFYGPGTVMRNASGELFVGDGPDPLAPGPPRAIFKVDPATGNRTVISGCIDEACTTTLGLGPSFVGLGGGSVLANGTLLVADLLPRAVLAVDPVAGHRSLVWDGTGSGGPFSPVWVKVTASGDVFVASPPKGVVRLFGPAISTSSIGSGPNFSFPVALTELPEPDAIPAWSASLALLVVLGQRRRRATRR